MSVSRPGRILGACQGDRHRGANGSAPTRITQARSASMITSPLVARRIADLHQGDQRAAAARSRLSRQACSTRVAGTRSQRTFAGQFTPRAGTAVATASALVASLGFGPNPATQEL